MRPVVLVQRTLPGDAFVYTRYAGRERTNTVEFNPVDVGVELPALTPDQVELLRDKPEQFKREFQ